MQQSADGDSGNESPKRPSVLKLVRGLHGLSLADSNKTCFSQASKGVFDLRNPDVTSDLRILNKVEFADDLIETSRGLISKLKTTGGTDLERKYRTIREALINDGLMTKQSQFVMRRLATMARRIEKARIGAP